jgi:beta-lactamase regulating signal transducer with metallopeptidase domain
MGLALELLKVTLLVAAGWAVTRALARAPAALRHDVWLLALIGALLVPAAERWLPSVYVGLPDAWERWMAPTSGALGLALVLWAVGVLIWIVRVAPSLVLLRRIRARGEQWRTPAVDQALREAARVAGVHRPITLLRSGDVQVPATWGVRRPVVVLPAAAASWSPDRLRLVLLHELGHVRRQDVLVEGLLWLTETLYWFHPAVWFAAGRLRLERERACDEAVLATGARASDYCEHLVEIMRAATRSGRGAVVGATMAAPCTLEERVRAMLAGPGRAPRARSRLATPLVVAGAVVIYAVGVVVPCIYSDDAAAAPTPRAAPGRRAAQT